MKKPQNEKNKWTNLCQHGSTLVQTKQIQTKVYERNIFIQENEKLINQIVID